MIRASTKGDAGQMERTEQAGETSKARQLVQVGQDKAPRWDSKAAKRQSSRATSTAAQQHSRAEQQIDETAQSNRAAERNAAQRLASSSKHRTKQHSSRAAQPRNTTEQRGAAQQHGHLAPSSLSAAAPHCAAAQAPRWGGPRAVRRGLNKGYFFGG